MTPKSECFDKPIWTVDALIKALPSMPGHAFRVLPTLTGRTLSNQFRERLMLAVTSENRCPYCKTVHTALGKISGLSEQDISAIMARKELAGDEGERLALQFVRDLARRDFQSRDEVLYEQLLEHFSPKQREAIESTAHVINLANRLGNTLDYSMALLHSPCDEERQAVWKSLTRSVTFLVGAAGVGILAGPLVVFQRLRSYSGL